MFSVSFVSSSNLMPKSKPILVKTFLISFKDFLPKFGNFNISSSVFCTKSLIVFTPIAFKQFTARTESSSSLILLLRVFYLRWSFQWFYFFYCYNTFFIKVNENFIIVCKYFCSIANCIDRLYPSICPYSKTSL